MEFIDKIEVSLAEVESDFALDGSALVRDLGGADFVGAIYEFGKDHTGFSGTEDVGEMFVNGFFADVEDFHNGFFNVVEEFFDIDID